MASAGGANMYHILAVSGAERDETATEQRAPVNTGKQERLVSYYGWYVPGIFTAQRRLISCGAIAVNFV